MYLKVMFVITGILLLLIAGCPQEEGGESGKSAGATDQVEEVEAKVAEGQSDAKPSEPSQSTDLGAGPNITEEEEGHIRTAILDAASNLQLTYDGGADALMGEGLPEEGESVPDLVIRTAQVIKSSNIEIDERTVTKVAQSIVADILPPPPGQEPPRIQHHDDEQADPSKGRQKSDVAASSQQIDKSKLKFAKQLIGDWKSTKEIHSRFTAQHDDDYFEFINISPENTIMFKRYRDGQLISDRQFDYTFNEERGEMKLRDNTGAVVNTLIAYNMGDEDTTLYLEFKSGTITVYDQVSRVGVPLTEEEKAGVAQPGIGEN